MSESQKGFAAWCAATVVAFLCVIVVAGLLIGAITGVKAWSRAQSRANANNQVALTHIRIRREQQQVKVVQADNGVVQAQAHQRYLESIGVRDAQDEIAKTLTPLYNQYDNTVVYVPAGESGVPVITANAGTGK